MGRIEVWHDEHGTKHVLTGDRDFGRSVFRYPPGDATGRE